MALSVRARTAALVATAVPVTLTAAAAVLKAGHWQLYADRHRIHLTPRPRPNCPRCHGDGGCWSDRRELRIRLLPVAPFPDEPPF